MNGNIRLHFIRPSLSGYAIDFFSLNMIVMQHSIPQAFYFLSLHFMKTDYAVLELAENSTLKKSRNYSRRIFFYIILTLSSFSSWDKLVYFWLPAHPEERSDIIILTSVCGIFNRTDIYLLNRYLPITISVNRKFIVLMRISRLKSSDGL